VRVLIGKFEPRRVRKWRVLGRNSVSGMCNQRGHKRDYEFEISLIFRCGLKTGGPDNRCLVEAIVFRSGSVFPGPQAARICFVHSRKVIERTDRMSDSLTGIIAQPRRSLV